MPTMVDRYELPVNVEGCRRQLRKKFEENSHLKDLRVIDMVVIKVSCFRIYAAITSDQG